MIKQLQLVQPIKYTFIVVGCDEVFNHIFLLSNLDLLEKSKLNYKYNWIKT